MYAVIVLGFDITHAVLTLTNYKPRELYVVIARVSGAVDERARMAYNSLEQVALAMRVGIKPLEVDVMNVEEAVEILRRRLLEVAERGPVVIDIGGGMRLLVFETVLAYFSLPSELVDRMTLVAYAEGTNRLVELDARRIYRIIGKASTTLTRMEQVVLDSMEENTMYSLNEIHKTLKLKGIEISKQYIGKLLKKLESKGLIVKVSRGKYMRKHI